MTTPPSASRTPFRLMLAGVILLAVIGLAFLILAIILLTRGNTPVSGTATARPTLAFTSVVAIPTTTPAPPTNTPEPTATVTVAPTEAPPTEPVATAIEARAHIVQPANVRAGPGTTYTTLGGLNAGDTPLLLGRDTSARWFAIAYEAGPGGVGWVSDLVATIDGDANSLPVVASSAATQAPAAVPTNTNPPPANTSAPAAPTATSGPQGSHGVVGLAFSVENASAAPGQDVWFHFSVKNTSQSVVNYGALAAHTDAGVTAQSWTNEKLDPGASLLDWRDHINFPSAGTYQLYLGICYGDKNTCLANGASWDRLSDYITITIH